MLKGNTFGLKVESGRLLILLLTIAACVASALYFVLIRGIVEAHTHIFYVPIVLAGMWYHKKAVYVALFLSMAFLLAIHFSPLPFCIGAALRMAVLMSVAYIVGYISSKRAKGEEGIRESEEKYRSLVESTEDSIYLVDRDCRYLFVNDKYLSLIGLSMEEIRGRTYGELHSEEDTKEFAERVEEVFETSKSVSHEHRSR